jgi:hypothetical protein
MIKYKLIIAILTFYSTNLSGQKDTLTKQNKERLDFTKGYFEFGGTFHTSFTGKRLSSNDVISFDNST